MPIITIFRGAFSGGQDLAEQVAAQLGYRCVSREVLIEASRRYGIPETKFTEILEAEPRWWDKWRESLKLYRVALQAAMCEVAKGGNLVYHGHIGHEMLRGIHHVLKIHLTATMEFRIEQVRSREGMDAPTARRYIEHMNKVRSRRLQDLFGEDWHDPSRFDMVLNISQMSLETASQLIVTAARREEYQPTPESEQAFEDLILASRVEAALMTSNNTRNLNIHIRAERGVVHVTGVLTQPALQEKIVREIEGVQGVTKVIPDLEIAPLEYIFP